MQNYPNKTQNALLKAFSISVASPPDVEPKKLWPWAIISSIVKPFCCAEAGATTATLHVIAAMATSVSRRNV